MRTTTRWAALPTLLMALLNTPAGPTADPSDMPRTVAWVGTALGLAGLVAGIALLRRIPWARRAVVALGLVNAAAGVVAVAAGWAGGPIGIVLGLAAVALAFVPAREQTGTSPSAAAAQ